MEETAQVIQNVLNTNLKNSLAISNCVPFTGCQNHIASSELVT